MTARYLRAFGARLLQELDGPASRGSLTPPVMPGEAAARVALQTVVEVFGRHRVLQKVLAEAEVSGSGWGGEGLHQSEPDRQTCPMHRCPPRAAQTAPETRDSPHPPVCFSAPEAKASGKGVEAQHTGTACIAFPSTAYCSKLQRSVLEAPDAKFH